MHHVDLLPCEFSRPFAKGSRHELLLCHSSVLCQTAPSLRLIARLRTVPLHLIFKMDLTFGLDVTTEKRSEGKERH